MYKWICTVQTSIIQRSTIQGTSLVVQWLRLHMLLMEEIQARSLVQEQDPIGHNKRVCMLQLKILYAMTKTQCSHICMCIYIYIYIYSYVYTYTAMCIYIHTHTHTHTYIHTHTTSQLYNYMTIPHATAWQMRPLRFKVCVLSHFLLQPLQETQVCSRTRTNTFFILQNRNRSLRSQHHTPSIPSLNAASSCGKMQWIEMYHLCTTYISSVSTFRGGERGNPSYQI